MQIPVVGFDPSLNNWGIAEARLDLETGFLTDLTLSVVQPRVDKALKKKVRVNSTDLQRAEELADLAFRTAERAKVIFVEVPVGSQNARAMASYAVCIGILGSLRAKGMEIIEVTPDENKKIFTGNKNATKKQMIDEAFRLYPQANWPMQGGKIIESKAEHMADAVAAIHAGVHTPVFQNLMRLLTRTKE